ncbi:hypothetical protein [Hymenobacter perfusus]|uniref:DUF4199 domain-containing protein n=1 Tax=Hymenobacter perfusus TaxID=1236770 RepID=A0A428KB79_9BACT|nr:hypothetical protein [Hymenobacter perfusus]RSK43644.1 hypothetical protein EI293_12235 [Hymenobacter perfusus]
MKQMYSNKLGTMLGYGSLLALLSLLLFMGRTISRDFYASPFLYMTLLGIGAGLMVVLLYRSLRLGANEQECRKASFFLRNGIGAAVLGVLLSTACVFVYGRQIDDYYVRRLDWEARKIDSVANMTQRVKAEALQMQRGFDEAGLEEWMVACATLLGALVALGGCLPFVLEYKPEKVARASRVTSLPGSVV